MNNTIAGDEPPFYEKTIAADAPAWWPPPWALVQAYIVEVGDHLLLDPANRGAVEFEVVAIEVFMTATGRRKFHYRWTGFGPEPATKQFAAIVADVALVCCIHAPEYSAYCTARDKRVRPNAAPAAGDNKVRACALTLEDYEEAYSLHDLWLMGSPTTSKALKDAIKAKAFQDFASLRATDWEEAMIARCENTAKASKVWQPLPLLEEDKPRTKKARCGHAKADKNPTDAPSGLARAPDTASSDGAGDD